MNYEQMLLKNEKEVNSIVVIIAKIEFLALFIVFILNSLKIFVVDNFNLMKLVFIQFFLSLFPAFLVDVLKIKTSLTKYFLITSFIISTGIYFSVYTFHAVMMFLFPTIVATLYFDKKLMYFTMINTIVCILLSHFLSYYFCNVVDEPFTTMKRIFLYGCILRVIEYVLFSCVLLFLTKRTSKLLSDIFSNLTKINTLQIENILIDKNARLEEREKISVDIHNSVGHTITAAIMALEAADSVYEVKPEVAKEKMLIAKSHMHESLSSIRKAVRLLNNEENDVTTIRELVNSLIICINQFELDFEAKVKCNLNNLTQEEYSRNIDSKHSMFLYSALKEALTNSVKHGKSSAIIVLAKVKKNKITLLVQDNGSGFMVNDKEKQKELYENGFGLKQMKNYTSKFGGKFEYFSEDGFSVCITLPLEE